jgi:hypothetical protein
MVFIVPVRVARDTVALARQSLGDAHREQQCCTHRKVLEHSHEQVAIVLVPLESVIIEALLEITHSAVSGKLR